MQWLIIDSLAIIKNTPHRIKRNNQKTYSVNIYLIYFIFLKTLAQYKPKQLFNTLYISPHSNIYSNNIDY